MMQNDKKLLTTECLAIIKTAFCRWDIVIAILLLLLVFLGQAKLALYWDSLGIFNQFNVIFDSDPVLWKKYFSTGQSFGTPTHPLLTYIASVPVFAIYLFSSLFSSIDNGLHFRELLAVLASPAATALKVVLIYLSLRLMSLGKLNSFIISCIAALSFSSVVFGAVPSSYPFTGLMVALVCFFTVLVVRTQHLGVFFGLLLSGVLLVGVTVSNLAHLGWMLWVRFFSQKPQWIFPFVKAAATAIVVLIVTLGTFYSLYKLRGVGADFLVMTSESKSFNSTFGNDLDAIVANVLRFPERAGRTYIATVPGAKESKLYHEADRYNLELTYNTLQLNFQSVLLAIVVLIVLVGGCIIGIKKDGIWRYMALGSAGSLVTYGLLYSYFGFNTFLYSQAWQVQVIFLIAPWFTFVNEQHKRWVRLCGLAIVGVMLVADLYVLNEINQLIQASALF